ncbi:MAG: hypothetical protein JXB00_01385 [Bacteroidales bacterium]|nr:hypothetical protein [Bacteroidales bacterium]
MEQKTIIGIDFGGVILSAQKNTSKEDTPLDGESNYLLSPPNDLAFNGIKKLIMKFGREHVFIISKAGKKMQHRTEAWMEAHDFFNQTTINPAHVIFCNTRADKKLHCQMLGVTHFIDDRIHVMQLLNGTVPNLFLFGEKQKNKSARKWTTLVEDWEELLEYFQ